MEHLRRMGVSPHEEPTDTTRVFFLAPPGVHFRVGKTGKLIAFFYKDSIEAKKIWESLDTIRLSPKGDTTSYWGTTTYKPIRSGNLIAAFTSESDRTTERVYLSLMAGLPAPPK